MKAVIIAGGEGRRLCPLTEHIPKPLVSLCGRPVLAYLLDWLQANQINECILALGHQGALIQEYCENHPRANMRISYSQEESPLGTAGSVRLALKEDCPALIVSGDTLCDFSLTQTIHTHRKHGAMATVLTTKMSDPREYGIVLSTPKNRIIGFVEKPAFPQVIDETVNTGIYLLSAQAVARLPRQGDFAFDVFPALLQEGALLYADHLDGYWRDIGSIEAYLQAGEDLLSGNIGQKISEAPPKGNYFLRAPVWFGKNVKIGEGAIVGPYAILDDNSQVESQAQISHSVSLPNAVLGAESAIFGCVLCENTKVPPKAYLSNCAFRENSNTQEEQKDSLNSDRIECSDIVYHGFAAERIPFDERGIIGVLGHSITPEFVLALGCAIGSQAQCPVAVGYDQNDSCTVLADALKVGIRSTGTNAMDFGSTFFALFRFGVNCNGTPIGVYFSGRDTVEIQIIETGGLPAGRSLERAIERRFLKKEFRRADANRFGKTLNLYGFQAFYASQLLRCAPGGLEGIPSYVSCVNPAIKAILTQSLTNLGSYPDSKGIILEVSQDGTQVALKQGKDSMDALRTVAAYGKTRFCLGEDLAVENHFPRAFDDFAASFGSHIQRYLSCPANDSDAIGRGLAAHQCVGDGLRLGITLLSQIHDRKISFHDLAAEIPMFITHTESIPLSMSPGQLLPHLAGTPAGEGILLDRREQGKVLVRASKSGKALKLFAEAASNEIAQELCAQVIDQVQKCMKNKKI